MSDAPFRSLPPVNAVLDQPELEPALARHGRAMIVEAVRRVLAEARRDLAEGRPVATDAPSLARRAESILAADGPRLRPVLNASGILLHTGLGRAPLAAEAIEAVARVARGYCNLEIELETGERGHRAAGVADLLCRLTGAEAATVVNNNAAATVLALRALAVHREVIVSRGQLVEIGGSFRLPEIFAVSGARLREVGTTNKTRVHDYAGAIGSDTAALLHVHTSNFKVVGFTESVPIGALAALGKSRGLLTIDDIGSGALGADRPPQVPGEPTAAASLAAGADLVLASGDKLLGGPQCGLMMGSKEVIARIASDPLMRAMRVDKLTLAALEATLRLALNPAIACERIPLWAFLTARVDTLRERAERLAEALRTAPGLNAQAVESAALLGGGSAPTDAIPSFAVRISAPFPEPWQSEAAVARALRSGDPPVVPRTQGNAVLFDLRAISEAEDGILLEAIRRVLGAGAQPPAGPAGLPAVF